MTTGPHPAEAPRAARWSRRGLLGFASAAVGVGAGAGSGALASRADDTADPGTLSYAFRGAHQAGITTPVQEHLYFASFDISDGTTREQLIELLKRWTVAAERLTQGLDVSEAGAVNGPELLPPDDTGEALGLGPHGLTLTFGFGPSLFSGELGERLGLSEAKPGALADLPLFAFDLIEQQISGGDLCVQACAEDPQVAVHAIRNLSRIAFGKAQIRWSQLGFGRTASTSREQSTPRNLFGFKDGTANVMADQAEALSDWVWTKRSDSTPAWMVGGSYLVSRKIAMTIENWDRVTLQEQEQIIGRNKGEGAPLTGTKEFDEPDFANFGLDSQPVIAVDSHVRLSHPDQNNGARMLRRSFNYVEGNNDLGQLSAGLFFISFQHDPAVFKQIQGMLATDRLNEYIRHISSSVFAVPRGIAPGEYVGQGIFT